MRAQLLVVVSSPNTSASVLRVDRASLVRIGSPVTLGEYHAAWAISPDRTHAAFGISAPGRAGRIGIRLVDLGRWKVTGNVEAGIAADVLWWPSARRLVAVLGSCICGVQQAGFVVADASTARVVKRVRFPRPLERFGGGGFALTAHGLVVLLDDRDAPAPAPARLAVIAADGSYRMAAVDRIRVTGRAWGSARVTAIGDRAIVVSGGIAAEIDLAKLAVSYHEVEAPGAASRFVSADTVGGVVVVAGRTADRAPLGVHVLDPATWVARRIDDAAAVTVAGDVIVAYGVNRPGIRGFHADGSRVFSILDRVAVRGVAASGSTVYVETDAATVVVDARTGAIVRRLTPARRIEQVIDPRGAQRAGAYQ